MPSLLQNQYPPVIYHKWWFLPLQVVVCLVAKISSCTSMRAYVGRRHNLYPHFQIMDFSISNCNLRCKLALECSMVGAMTILAYVNSVSPSCVYFITLHRLHKQTRAESEHSNQNQNQIGLLFIEMKYKSDVKKYWKSKLKKSLWQCAKFYSN